MAGDNEDIVVFQRNEKSGHYYVRGSVLSLNVYADADYTSKANARRSVSGIAATLGGTVVSHACKTQRVVSLLTSEAEYIAAGDGVKEALFVRAVLSFIAPETCVKKKWPVALFLC